MTAEKDSIEIKRGNPIKLPLVPRVCFTELRLSQSRVHAKRYGRLGIGVKHPYVFERGGRPVSYIRPPEFSQPKQDIFLQGVLERLGNESPLLHFFKSMGDIATYSFYAESEWRVIHCDEHPTVSKSEDSAQMEARTPKFKEYIEQMPNPNEARRKLRRLLPLDGWLSCIIYPSVSVKAAALNDERIRAAIKRIKEDQSCRANTVEGGNYPIEMDLDMCRNF
jgi:hypothetical protein